MFTKSANRLTNSLIHNEVISESDFELYSFGFETAFAITANIITTVLIGALFHMTLESLLFLAAFIPLRSYVGGFHASNHFRCYWLSILAVVLVLFAARFILDAYHAFIVMGIGVICIGTMFMLVPVQDENRPLEDIEIRVYRKRARIVLCAELIIMAILSVMGLKMAVSIFLCTMILACASVCVGAIKNYIRPIS